MNNSCEGCRYVTILLEDFFSLFFFVEEFIPA